MKWIKTLGGPFVVADRSVAINWNGNLARLDGTSDYEDACQLNGWANKLQRSGGDFLILAMPNDTALVPVKEDEALIIRIEFANDYESVEQHISRIPSGVFGTNGSISFPSGRLIIFDSVYSFAEVSESLECDLVPGTYEVSTALEKPDDETSLFVMKLGCPGSAQGKRGLA